MGEYIMNVLLHVSCSTFSEILGMFRNEGTIVSDKSIKIQENEEKSKYSSMTRSLNF